MYTQPAHKTSYNVRNTQGQDEDDPVKSVRVTPKFNGPIIFQEDVYVFDLSCIFVCLRSGPYDRKVTAHRENIIYILYIPTYYIFSSVTISIHFETNK